MITGTFGIRTSGPGLRASRATPRRAIPEPLDIIMI